MERCPFCPGINKCVSASGPPAEGYSGVVFIGEAPGKDEDRKGVPFVGKTGEEVNWHYLPIAGLRRDDCYFTYSIKCLPATAGAKLSLDRPKDVELLLSCASFHLEQELSQMQPKLIVPMGALACCVLDPDIQLDLHHGIPRESSWGMLFPMWHPAGGLHEPKKMLHIRNDFVRLGKYLKGKLRQPVDEYPNPYYARMDLYAMGQHFPDKSWPLACDTEVTKNGDPFCLTFSSTPGTGYLIKAGDKDLGHFQWQLDNWTGPILFHNWLFDGEVVRRMGLRFPEHLIVDTMVMAFHLGNLPQGLKALSYRLLGMKMTDFEDTVLPYSTPLCLDYLRRCNDYEWERPPEQLVRGDDGLLKLYKPQSFNTKLKRFFTDLSKNPSKSVFGAWDNWEDSHAEVEAKMGPFPGMCITHVPLEDTIYYACRDADSTLRLYSVLRKMQRMVRRKPQEHWGDYETIHA